jgi:hypothetical protein
MRVFLTLTVAAVLAAGLSESNLRAQLSLEQPHLVGVWRLDVEKSRYSPGPPPKGEVRTYARDASGVTGKIERHYADGRLDVIEYRADYDRDYPVSGTRLYDLVRFRRVDEHTTEGVLSHAGSVYGSSRRTISADGRTLTITFRRTEPGDMVNNVALYHKER